MSAPEHPDEAPPKDPEENPSGEKIWPGRWLALGLLAPALMWFCWRAPFYILDDNGEIRDKLALKASIPWTEVFKVNPGDTFFYPVTLLSWRIDRVIWTPLLSGWLGPDAWAVGIRFTNLLLHAASSVAVFATFRRLGAGRTLAAFGMAAFLLHPAACESVNWPIERKNVLAGCCALYSAYWYFSARSWRGYTLAALLFALALFSKPSALGLFAVLAVWEGLERPIFLQEAQSFSLSNVAKTWPRAALRLVPHALLALMGICIGVAVGGRNVIPPPGGSVFTALLTDMPILRRYVENFIWPTHLSFYYHAEPVVSVADPRLWISVAALGVVVVLSLLGAGRSWRMALFGWFWFVGALGPNLNLVGINDLMHDRFAYLSAPGLWLALGTGLAGAAAAWQAGRTTTGAPAPNLKTLGVGGVLAVALAFALASVERSRVYADSVLLLDDASKKEPLNAFAHFTLGRAYKDQADAARKAGNAASAQKILVHAAFEFAAALEAPDLPRYFITQKIHALLAGVLFELGEEEQALAQIQQVLHSPTGLQENETARSGAEQTLGWIMLKHYQPTEALQHFDEALRIDPDARSIHVGRALAFVIVQDTFEKHGNLAEARRFYELACEALRQVRSGDPAFDEAREKLAHIKPPAE